jgi:apolipoprotein N-acyltransferase
VTCALSGLLLSLALPPANLGWLAFLAPIPLLWLVREVRPWRGALLGLAFGVAYFGAVLYWIWQFGQLAWGALTLACAAYLGVFGLLAPAVWRWDRPIRSVAGLAALWTVQEWLRGMWPVGGFGWGQLGSTQTGNPFLIRLASVTGVWGVSFTVVLVAGLLMLAVERARSRPTAAAVLAGIALVLSVSPGLIPIPRADGQTLDVAAVQVDVRRARDLPPVQEDQRVAEMNVALHRRLAADPPDLAVWGESALDPGASATNVRSQVTEAIRDVGVPTLAGAVVKGPDGAFHNEGLLFGGDGRLIGEYRKVHLVPFGEYVPFRDELSWISALQQIPYDETPGERIHPLRFDGITFGDVICFENSFPSIDRSLIAQGAGFLVVQTNNASYGFTAASRQHLLMSQLRAVENGRWVVHAAVSGISAFIDPDGRVVAETGLFEPAILRHRIQVSIGRTLYTRFGDWVPWASLVLSAGLLFARRGRRRPGRPVEPLPERPRTLVILPTYDERATIEAVIRGLLALADAVDVLVVDDSSPDGTAEVVRAIAAGESRVRLEERPAKAGLAGAYREGFARALDEGYDLVVEMDADLSHDPAELPSLLSAAHGFDLVVGSRYIPGGSVTNWSHTRLALSRAGNAYARRWLGLPLHDATSGFRVFRRDLLAHLAADPIRSEGYGFQIELVLRASEADYALGEAPITFRERQHGRSKISRRIVIEALWLVTVWGARMRLGAPSLPSP